MKTRRRSDSVKSGNAAEPRHLKAAADRLILAAAGDLVGPEVLLVLLHGTTLASALREQRPDLNFTFYTPEHFFLTTLQEFHPECRPPATDAALSAAKKLAPAEPAPGQPAPGQPAPGNSVGEVPQVLLEGTVGPLHTRIRLVCSSDLPMHEFDTVVIPVSATGTAEQTQELLQTAHQRLRDGGLLIAATDNPGDKWLHQRLTEIFDRATVRNQRDGVLYLTRRTGSLKRVRDFTASCGFRFLDRVVLIETRPGVFSHRRIDGGARALIHSLSRLNSDGRDGEAGGPVGEFRPRAIVDLGCGSGAVAVAAGLMFPEAHVLAMDSHARAVACTAANAARNQIDRFEVCLASDAVLPRPGSWDLILTNPPYYSDYRISELFLQAARHGLRRRGRIHLVTKLTDWHVTRMNQLFRHVVIHEIGEYKVLTAEKA